MLKNTRRFLLKWSLIQAKHFDWWITCTSHQIIFLKNTLSKIIKFDLNQQKTTLSGWEDAGGGGAAFFLGKGGAGLEGNVCDNVSVEMEKAIIVWLCITFHNYQIINKTFLHRGLHYFILSLFLYPYGKIFTWCRINDICDNFTGKLFRLYYCLF